MTSKTALFILLASLVFAQGLKAADYDAPLGRFRVVLTNGKIVHGYDGSLTPEGLVGDFSADAREIIPRDDIRMLHRYAGTKSRTGAQVGCLVGLTVGLVASLSTIKSIGSTSEPVDNTRVVAFVMVPVVAGGLIGAAIGSASPRWEDIPLATTIDLRPDGGQVRLAFNLAF